MSDEQIELPEADEPTVPATAKKPQDRRKKAAVFTFTGLDGKNYPLPKISEKAAMAVPGAITMDLLMDPEDGQANIAMAFHLLKNSDPAPESFAALRAFPTEQMMQIIEDWAGESQRSAD